jgi:hypothetical protein
MSKPKDLEASVFYSHRFYTIPSFIRPASLIMF